MRSELAKGVNMCQGLTWLVASLVIVRSGLEQDPDLGDEEALRSGRFVQ